MIDKAKRIQQKYNLTDVQLAHFLGQLSHESLDFKVLSENLNYSANGLLKTFPKYFNLERAQKYARKPEQIANLVYANRMGNGDEKSGDGWRFRGRGYIQLTGKDNYEAFSKFIGEDCVKNPDLVAQKYPLESAIWFFKQNNIFSLAKDLSDYSILKVTKKINGGSNGFADRKSKTLKYYDIIKK
jgi:putative chitinase